MKAAKAKLPARMARITGVLRARQALARAQFTRTVLPHVEPMVRVMQPGQAVGLEELFWIWAHDPEVRRLLDDENFNS